MSIAVEDWDELADELSTARRRRGERAAAEVDAAEATSEATESAPRSTPLSTSRTSPPSAPQRARGTRVRHGVISEIDDDDDFEYAQAENMRPLLSIAAGNIAIWVLAHLTGVVELIGVSFLASVGLLLASYILREWHRDRSALVCLVGALPLPVTIFSLLT